VIHAKEGAPLRLIFDRQETSSCSEEVVIGDFGVKRFLPAFQKTVVELTPDRTGRFDFTCGMGMLHGTLIVER
jgi:P-type Cu+ transporter